jgi:hypothetical protein
MQVDDEAQKNFKSLTQAEMQSALNVADGATANTGTVTNVTVGTGLDVSNGTSTPSITLDLTELGDAGLGELQGSADKLVVLATNPNSFQLEQKVLIAEDVNLSAFDNDQGWTSNTGTTTASNSQTFTNKTWNGAVIHSDYLSADTAHLSTTQTFSGAKTFSSLASFTMDGNTITGIDDSSEFTDNDAHIMTSAAVQDKILSYNYTTNSGDITAVTTAANSGLSGGATNGPVALSVNTGAVAEQAVTIPTGGHVYDYIDGLGLTGNQGTITSVSGGTGLSGGGTSGGVTLAFDGTELASHTIGNGTGTITINGTLSVDGDKVLLGQTTEIEDGAYGLSFNHGSNKFDFGGDVDFSGDLVAVNGDFSGDVAVSGDLTVSGDTVTVNTEEILLADNNIVLNSNYTGSSPTDGGITIERGTAANVAFYWNEAKNQWFADCLEDASGNGRVALQKYFNNAPTSNDEGAGLGQFWINTTNWDLYIRTE